MQDNMKRIGELSDTYYDRYSFVKQNPEYNDALPFVKRKTIRISLALIQNIIACPQYFTKRYLNIKVNQLRSIPITQDDKLHKRVKLDMYMIKISPKLYTILKTLYVRIFQVTNKLKITNRQTVNLNVW